MKPITRDIVWTLFIKLTLLTALWFICFKTVEKPETTTAQWLLGNAPENVKPVILPAVSNNDGKH
ncbi:cytochrome oxidase putative small subunit CydP [Legionella spiritensis]|uniref:cytochrome oxidase putative small subunit CydP n=1 Tax=Legionella spiritensis TaxID=452 RepID=UPI000F6FC4E5|nr:cytochrome oxidase putative small subunit CydP [Legionella spiritensis]VEG90504.1 Uncharacterised protein [Legionella spiritensis]